MRQEWLARSAPLSDEPPRFQARSGMEVWLTAPEDPDYRSPPKYKTIALNYVALYPVYVVMRWALMPVTAGWEPVTPVALRTGIAVVLAGYGVMPMISRTFRDWLFPPDLACQNERLRRDVGGRMAPPSRCHGAWPAGKNGVRPGFPLFG